MISMKTAYASAKPIEIEEENPEIMADSTIYAESRKSPRTKKASPHPFANVYYGPTPAQFSTTTRRTTTPRYPQLNEYRHRLYPKSIQDIIAYMTTTHEKQTRKPTYNHQDFNKYGNGYRESQSQVLFEQRRNNSGGFSLGDSDPFYSYKPQDPSDINLLATGKLRFAPPVWKNLRKKPPKYNQQQEENSNKEEVFNENNVVKKPIMLSVSIFPFDSEIVRPGQKYGRRQVPYRIQAYLPNGNQEESKRETMVIHLNVYPNDMFISEDAQESRLRGNFVGFIKGGSQ